MKSENEFPEFLQEEIVESKVESKLESYEEPDLEIKDSDDEMVEKTVEVEELIEVEIDVEEEGIQAMSSESELESEHESEPEHVQASPLVSADTEVISPRESTPTKSGSSPFTSVNFFQTGSPSATRTPKNKLKRRLEEEETSSRKKHEAFEGPDFIPETPTIDESIDYSQYETPNQPPEPIAPYTAPAPHNPSITSTNAGSFSVGRPSNNLQGTGAGRRISFMPPVDQLRMSERFAQQLGSPSPKVSSTPLKVESSPPTSPGETSFGDETATEFNDIEEKLEAEDAEAEIGAEADAGTEDEETTSGITTRKPRDWTPFFFAIKVSLLMISISLFAQWFVLEKREAGYCEAPNHNLRSPYYGHITPTNFKEYFEKEYILDRSSQLLDYVRPECVACPVHATCFSGFQARCDSGFLKVESPFSIGGFLPIAPSCRPDTQKYKRVQMVTEKALEILRERHAKVECGSLDEAAIEKDELRNLLYKKTVSANYMKARGRRAEFKTNDYRLQFLRRTLMTFGTTLFKTLKAKRKLL